MKKSLLFVVFSMWLFGKAQWVSIPDANFALYLQGAYPSCMNGNLMDTTCSAIVNQASLYYDNVCFSDITGIEYFDNLQTLLINNTCLTTINSLPSRLTYLRCTSCPYFSHLCPLPAGLKRLVCSGNLLTSLPALPDSLTWLEISSTNYVTLPTLPNTITYLVCSPINYLPELPDSLETLSVSGANLHCLPYLKKVVHFSIYQTGIICLPNYPEANLSSWPSISNYPLCDSSSFNIYGCGINWNVSGKIYQDTIANCAYDSGEISYRNLKVMLYKGGNLQQQIFSVASGGYSFTTDSGTYNYTIDTANLPFSVACPDSGYYTSVITPLDSVDGNMDFSLRCKPGFDIAVQSVHGFFQPALNRRVDIRLGDLSNFYDGHCASGINGKVTITINGSGHYTYPAFGALTPDSVNGNTLIWNVIDFGTVDFNTSFNIMFRTDTNAVAGSQICFAVSVTPTIGDYDSTNNQLNYCATVVSSLDPNEKEVLPSGNIDTAQRWLTYTINFQNTGTAYAQFIYINDTLDTNLDPGSFQLLAYSHRPVVQIIENAIRFYYPDISLPDSNHYEAGSHAYVQYKVKLKDNLPLGTIINNTAYIYFDFNSAVVTNTTSNTISTNTGIQSSTTTPQFSIFPNPASNTVTITIDETMLGSTATVTDITGRKMAAAQLQTLNYKLETANFANGVYFISLENEKGRVTKKLVIQK